MIEHFEPGNSLFLQNYGQYPILFPSLLKVLSLLNVYDFEYFYNILFSSIFLLSLMVFSPRLNFTTLFYLALIGLPIAAVWAQDEVLAVPLLIYLTLNNEKVNNLQLFIILIGSLAFKVFFIFFIVSVLLKSNDQIIKKFTLILCLLIMTSLTIYGLVISNYIPKNDFTFGLMSLFEKSGILNFQTVNKFSRYLLSIILLASATFIYFNKNKYTVTEAYVVFMLIFCLFNNHVNPEYLIFIAVPFLVLGQYVFPIIIVSGLAWSQNILNYLYRQTNVDYYLYADIIMTVLGAGILLLLLIKICSNAKQARYL